MSIEETATLPTSVGEHPGVLEPVDLVKRIARVTQLSTDEVVERLQRESDDLGCTVRAELAERQIVPHVWSEGLVEFYRTSNAMFFETVVWNRTALKQSMRQWILDFLERDQTSSPNKTLRVLTYGDGLGFDSLALARAGHAVDYSEVSETCVRFAGEMFVDAGVNITILSSPEEVMPEQYDAAVCLDVLEHVPDPREVVRFLTNALRPGGRLIVHAPFYYLTPAVQTHLRSNQTYSGELRKLYGQCGLRAIDANWFWDPLVLEKREATSPQTRRSLAAQARLGLGKLSLTGGRYWSAPHCAVVRWLLSQDRQDWQALVRQ